MCPKCDQSPNSVACECWWSHTWLQRAHCDASAASASATHNKTADMSPGVSRAGAPTYPIGALPHGSSLSAAAAWGNHTANYRDCIKWKEVKAALSKQAPERVHKSATTGHPDAPKFQRARPSAKQMDLGKG